MKRTHLILFLALSFTCSSPAFAQRSRPGGGPPAVGPPVHRVPAWVKPIRMAQ